MPGLLDFIRDPESQKRVGRGLLDAANRGLVANTLGGPVDMATALANLGVAGVGYAGHKAGLLKTPPDLIDPATVPGSSEWIGKKMERGGMVSQDRNPVAEAGFSMLAPVAYKGAQKAGGLLFNAEQRAMQNLAQPSTMQMQGQRGAIVWHGSPHKFDKFDASKIGTGEGAQAYGHGLYLAESPEVAQSYRAAVSAEKGRAFGLDDGPTKGIATLIAARGRDGETLARKAYASLGDQLEPTIAAARQAVDGGSSLYKVDLPDEVIAKMLDWDKPLSQQPPEVQKALNSPQVSQMIDNLKKSGHLVFYAIINCLTDIITRNLIPFKFKKAF